MVAPQVTTAPTKNDHDGVQPKQGTEKMAVTIYAGQSVAGSPRLGIVAVAAG